MEVWLQFSRLTFSIVDPDGPLRAWRLPPSQEDLERPCQEAQGHPSDRRHGRLPSKAKEETVEVIDFNGFLRWVTKRTGVGRKKLGTTP